MTLSIIVAASENNVIGKSNALPWSLPADMKFFKNTTWGMPLIMGRKTLKSMDDKPLPGRMNIVLTSQKDFEANGVVLAKDWDEALIKAKDADCKEVFIIGGGKIFEDGIKMADRIYMTRVHAIIEGDVFFPVIDKEKWKLSSSRDVAADEKHAFSFTFERWEKV